MLACSTRPRTSPTRCRREPWPVRREPVRAGDRRRHAGRAGRQGRLRPHPTALGQGAGVGRRGGRGAQEETWPTCGCADPCSASTKAPEAGAQPRCSRRAGPIGLQRRQAAMLDPPCRPPKPPAGGGAAAVRPRRLPGRRLVLSAAARTTSASGLTELAGDDIPVERVAKMHGRVRPAVHARWSPTCAGPQPTPRSRGCSAGRGGPAGPAGGRRGRAATSARAGRADRVLSDDGRIVGAAKRSVSLRSSCSPGRLRWLLEAARVGGGANGCRGDLGTQFTRPPYWLPPVSRNGPWLISSTNWYSILTSGAPGTCRKQRALAERWSACSSSPGRLADTGWS